MLNLTTTKSMFALVLVLIGASRTDANAFRGVKQEQTPLPNNVQRKTQGVPVDIVANPDAYEVMEGISLRVDAPGVLGNDVVSFSTPYMSTFDEVGVFSGSLKVKDDGRVEYEPAAGFVGTAQFTYTACLRDADASCATATAIITVTRDPNRPNKIPTAINDVYSVNEGQTLSVPFPGFLTNDNSGIPLSPLIVCEREGSPTGDLNTDVGDGSFEYTSEKCTTGFDTFTYTTCYRDYEEMVSSSATVTIQVVQDPNRPAPPGAKNDNYTIYDGEAFEVSADTGLLSNDVGGTTLFVSDETTPDGFLGDLRVEPSGAFRYTPVVGAIGSYEFTYEVCFSDWKCVGCTTATVALDVMVNPNKPTNPPVLVDDSYEVASGEVLQVTAPGILDNDMIDVRYSLTVTDYTRGDDFVGTFNGEVDGSFEFGNAPNGLATFNYTACYNEWPDLCADGQIKLYTGMKKPEDTSFPVSGGAAATSYEVNWKGRAENECEALEPSLTLSCSNEGELRLLENSTSICAEADNGNVQCAAALSGAVLVECSYSADSNGTIPRELVVELSSQPVACNTNMSATLYYASHSIWLKTLCGDEWVNRGVGCTGKLIEENGRSVCYEDHTTLGADVGPGNVTVRSSVYEQCATFTDSEGVVPIKTPEEGVGAALGLPTFEITGDNDSFLLGQACQGDCDVDSDCGGDLICFQRDRDEAIPGCVGTPVSEKDYCIAPPIQQVVSRVGPHLDSFP